MTTETNAGRLKRIKSEWNGDDILCVVDIDWLIEQAERAIELEQSTTVAVIKRRNGKATIIRWNDERYVFQSESSARGGIAKRG